MPEVTAYPPGTPSWVDLGTPDIPGAAVFYGGLFGWDTPEGSPETGYVNCTYKGRSVAGLGRQTGPGSAVLDHLRSRWRAPTRPRPTWREPAAPRSSSRWTSRRWAEWRCSSIRSVHPSRSGKRPTTSVPPSSTSRTRSAGTRWPTRDPDTAVRFYGEVFGWEAVDDPQSAHGYRMWVLGGRRVGGLLTMDENFPAGIPPHWMPFFAVDDIDAAITRTQRYPRWQGADRGHRHPARPFRRAGRPPGAHFSVVALVQADPPP